MAGDLAGMLVAATPEADHGADNNLVKLVRIIFLSSLLFLKVNPTRSKMTIAR